MFKDFSELVQKLHHHGLLGILKSLRFFFKSLKIQHTHNNDNLQQLEHPKNILLKFNHYRSSKYQNFEKTRKNL
jgi:hypothetical protein